MRIEVLELIVEIVRSGSISAAARRKHVQQTTLSAALKSVEKELNITIFERQHNGVLLTREGEELMKIAEQMLALYYSMMVINQPADQKLIISVNRLIYCYFCYDILPKLHMHFPELSITVTASADDSLLDKPLSALQLGIGCCRPEQLHERKKQADALDLMLIELLTSEFMIYVNKDNSLSEMKQISGIEHLRGQRVILDSYCVDMYHTSGLNKIVKSVSLMSQFDPMQLINAVVHGNMLAYAVDKRIIPLQFHSSMEDIVPLYIAEPEGNHLRHITHYIVCRRKRQLTPSGKAVVEFISEMMQA